MSALREIKARARSDLHEGLKVSALYIAAPGGPALPIGVRVHTKFAALGNVQPFDGAERQEPVPRLIFRRSEIVPKRLGIVSVEPGEAYRVENVLPPDGDFVTAQVVRLPAEETAGLPVPG